MSTKVWHAIHSWFFCPKPMMGMVICRITLGLMLFFDYLLRIPHIPTLYGPEGVGGFEFLKRFPEISSHLFWTKKPLSFLSYPLFSIDSLTLTYLMFALLLVTSLCFTVGLWTRLSGVITLLLHAGFYARAPFAYFGWAIMIQPFLVYVLLSKAHGFYSLDALRRNRSDSTGPAWPLRLLQIHVCLTYLVVVLARIHSGPWEEGQVTYFILANNHLARWEFAFYEYKALWEFVTYATMAIEGLAPFLPLASVHWIHMGDSLDYYAFRHLGYDPFRMVEFTDDRFLDCVPSLADL